MPFLPIAHDGCEFSGLQIEPAIVPWRDAERIFVKAHLRPAIARIETAIQARLDEDVNGRADLRVEEEGEARIEEAVTGRFDEAGRGPLEKVAFQVHQSAESRADLVVE